MAAVLVERGHHLDGRQQLRALLEDRRAEVGVVEHLEFLPLAASVGHGVVDPEGQPLRQHRELGRQLELRPVEHPLVDDPADRDLVRRLALGDELDLLRGEVRDPAVQRQVHRRLGARVGDVPIGPRLTVPFQPAAAEPLIEPVQPAEPAAALEVDEVRVDDLLDRRIPAEDPGSVVEHGVDPHAARRDQGDLEPAVIDPEDIDAFLLPPEVSVLPDRPGARAFRGHVAADDDIAARTKGSTFMLRLAEIRTRRNGSLARPCQAGPGRRCRAMRGGVKRLMVIRSREKGASKR